MTLGAASILMAAKLNETPSPCLELITDVIVFKQKKRSWRDEIVHMEGLIIRELCFELDFASPLLFLDRFFRIFNLMENSVEPLKRVDKILRESARYLCFFMQREADFLEYRPS